MGECWEGGFGGEMFVGGGYVEDEFWVGGFGVGVWNGEGDGGVWWEGEVFVVEGEVDGWFVWGERCGDVRDKILIDGFVVNGFDVLLGVEDCVCEVKFFLLKVF